ERLRQQRQAMLYNHNHTRGGGRAGRGQQQGQTGRPVPHDDAHGDAPLEDVDVGDDNIDDLELGGNDPTLSNYGNANNVEFQLYYRRDVYVAFLLLVLLNMIFEIAAHAAEGEEFRYQRVILLYEISNALTVIAVMLLVRPRIMSPYWYVLPVYHRL